MTSVSLRALAEVDFVCSVLGDPQQFREVQHITPDRLKDPMAKALWTIAYPQNAQVAAASVFAELPQVPGGGRVMATYPSVEALRSLWLRRAEVGPAADLAVTICEDDVKERMDYIVTHMDPTLTASEQALVTAKQLMLVAGSITPPSNDFALADAADEVFERYVWRVQNPYKQEGWKTGMPQYDRFLKGIGGLTNGKLVVTGAPSGYGKTHWLLNLGLKLLTTPRDDNGQTPRIGFFSLEMSPYAMSSRITSWFSEVGAHSLDPNGIVKMREARDWVRKINTDYRFISVHNIYSIEGIRRKAMQLQQQHGLDLILIDYIGIVQGSGKFSKGGSYEQVGEVANGMQEMALSMDIPVVTLAQLNREATKGESGKGGKENIADSQKIERAADAIHIMWRPEKHSKLLSGGNAGKWKDVLILETPKVRSGVTPGPMYFTVNEEISHFTDIEGHALTELKSEEQQRLAHGIR